MNREQFKQRMKSLKSYREKNPGKGYWEWKVEAFQPGGDNTPLWLQGEFAGPQYSDVREDLRVNDPDAYNRLQEQEAIARSPSSEIVRYFDADGKLQTRGNLKPTKQVMSVEDLPEQAMLWLWNRLDKTFQIRIIQLALLDQVCYQYLWSGRNCINLLEKGLHLL